MQKVGNLRFLVLPTTIGLCIIAGAMFLSENLEKNANTNWLSAIGAGLIAPACGSSVPATTCVGSSPQATISYDYSQTGSCGTVTMTLSSGASQSSSSCTGSFTFPGLLTNHHYLYTVSYTDVSGPGADSGSFNTPSCTGLPYITSSSGSVYNGGSVVLTWDGAGASQCTGTNFSTGNAPSGSTTVTPSTTTTYNVNCGGNNASVTVQVLPADISLVAEPARVRSGNTSTLTWSSRGTTSCLLTGGGLSETGLSGSIPTNVITAPTLYTLTCQTADGPLSATAIVGPLPVFQEQ